MFAVIKTGGKQYIVEPDMVVSIEKLEGQAGDSVAFDALLTVDGDAINVGSPLLPGKVHAEIIEHGRHKKIEVVHYKPKSRHTTRRGHRQPFTKVKISKID